MREKLRLLVRSLVRLSPEPPRDVPIRHLALRVIRAVRSGILCTATITTLDVTGPGTRQTLDSLKHGFAIGTRDVHRRGVPFSETFEIDEPWIARLAIGSQLDVLAHPIKSKSLLDLGPSTDAAIRPSVLIPNP